jgi:hypothetical protein
MTGCGSNEVMRIMNPNELNKRLKNNGRREVRGNLQVTELRVLWINGEPIGVKILDIYFIMIYKV